MIYNSVRDSLFALCNRFIQDMAAAYPTDPGIANYNFDAFSEENTLPAQDFVGVRGYTLELDTKLATITAMFGVSTTDDKNLFRLEKLTGELLSRLLPETRVPIYETESNPAELIGYMAISAGTSVSPVLRALQRPLRFISIRGGLSLAVQAQ